MTGQVSINHLATGVPGLDALLGGGLSEFSFNLLAGAPGSGKTTLACQIMFALASPQRCALYFTVLGEPPLKILRYQQQFTFFDVKKIGESVHFVNLTDEVRTGDFDQVLARILREIKAHAAGLVFVDSFRSIMLATKSEPDRCAVMQYFVQELAMHLASWEATAFLVGEYVFAESETNAVFTVADGLIWLTQNIHRDSMVRKMEVKKMRGQAPLPGLHTFRITNAGVHVFPRAIVGAAITPPPAVIDSLSGFELALTPTYSENFRESLYRMVAVLTGRGLTVLMTSELEDRYTDLRFSPYGTAFLTDAIIVQRYIELKSKLRRVIAVVKVRGSAHSNELHLFEINEDGFVIGDPLVDYEGFAGLAGH